MSKAIATRKPETVTLEVSSLGLTPATMRKPVEVEQFQRDVSHIGDAVAAIGRAGNGLMWDQALILANTDVSDVIGKDDKPFPTVGSVGVAMGLDSKGYVSRLHRIGRAVIWYGVRAGSADFQILCDGSYGASQSYFRDFLGSKMTEAPTKAQRDGFRKALAQAKADKTAGKEAPKAPRKPSGETDQTDKSATKSDAAPTGGDAMVLLHEVETILHSLTGEAAHGVREEMRRIVRASLQREAALTPDEDDEDDESSEVVAGEVVASE